MDKNQISKYRVLKYTNEDVLESNNAYPNFVSDGMILDLTDLTSEKDVFSYTVYYYNNNTSKIEVKDYGVVRSLEYIPEITVDDEYIVYIDLNTSKLYVRYYEVGVKLFMPNQILLSRFDNPLGTWNEEDGIYNCGVVVEFYSFNGNLINDFKVTVSNKNRDFIVEVPKYNLFCVYEQNLYEYYNYEIPFNKLGIWLNISEDERIVVNKEFKDYVDRDVVTNSSIIDELKPWGVFVFYGYNAEHNSNYLKFVFVLSLYEYSENGRLLFKKGFDDVFDIETFIGSVSMYTQNGGYILSDFINNEEFEPLKDEDDNTIGYYIYFYYDANIEYFYKDEL